MLSFTWSNNPEFLIIYHLAGLIDARSKVFSCAQYLAGGELYVIPQMLIHRTAGGGADSCFFFFQAGEGSKPTVSTVNRAVVSFSYKGEAGMKIITRSGQ